jgi:D-amino-acid dehydrogenase
VSSPDVVVVGAGAIGAAAAYELARHGARVAILERSFTASGCSHGNAGLISPSHSEALASPASLRSGLAWIGRRDGPLHVRPRVAVIPWLVRFAAASLPKRSAAASATLRSLTSASLALHEELAQAGLPTSFVRRGILSVYESEHALEHAAIRSRRIDGQQSSRLTREEARELLPALTPKIAGALYHLHEAHCDPGMFVQALLGASSELGAEVRTGVEILRLKRSRDRICELQTTAGTIHPAVVLLAAGVWTRELAASVGVSIPLEAGKGYHLELGSGTSDSGVPAFLEEARITATPLQGRLRITGTLDLSGLDLRVDPIRLQAIAHAARRTLTPPPDTNATGIWRGLRPCAPDGLPIIGRAEEIENLYLATGHAMLGIALAPATGEIIADLISGQTPRLATEPFAPSRFRRWPQLMQNHAHTPTGRS